MGITCPNTNLQEWKDLVDIHGENVAYGIWDAYKEGIPIEFYRASNKSDNAVFKRQIINEINKRAKDTFNLTKDIVTYYKEGDIYTIVKGTGPRDKSSDTLEITNKLRLENILEQMTLELGYSPFFIASTKNGKTFKVIPNDVPKVKYEATTTPVEVPDLENMDDISTYYSVSPNQVQYTLKSVNILLSDKAKQVFAKGEKAKWDLNKILTELAIPKEQKQLLLDLGITDREQLALELASKYAYSVEINTAKTRDISYDNSYTDEWGNYIDDTRLKELQKERPTQYYSNLTVPGGTNYTENEISTPLITPSIKGHAQFSTDTGIGWSRTDDRVTYNMEYVDFVMNELEKSDQLKIKCD